MNVCRSNAPQLMTLWGLESVIAHLRIETHAVGHPAVSIWISDVMIAHFNILYNNMYTL